MTNYYCSYDEAHLFASFLKLETINEWNSWLQNNKKPNCIPADPESHYSRSGWENWGVFLRPSIIPRAYIKFLTYNDAKDFILSLSLNSSELWEAYDKSLLPDDIPLLPEIVYRGNGWTTWGDYLGLTTELFVKKDFWTYEDAVVYAQSLKLKSFDQWVKYCSGKIPHLSKRPDKMPSSPPLNYKGKGWVDWPTFLGNNNISTSKRIFAPFAEARKFVRSLNLKNQNEWRKYSRNESPCHNPRPLNIPSAPERTYKNNGWINLGDFLGIKSKHSRATNICSYQEAEIYVRLLKLTTRDQWKDYCGGLLLNLPEKPNNIPNDPYRFYKNKGWISWCTFLGSDNISTSKRFFMSYEEAKTLARSLKLKSLTDWHKYSKGELHGFNRRPDNLPSNPNRTYKEKGWSNWNDFLGLNNEWNSYKKFWDYEKAKEYVQRADLKSNKEWRKWIKGELPNNLPFNNSIPRSPDITYKNKGWNGWFIFLREQI